MKTLLSYIIQEAFKSTKPLVIKLDGKQIFFALYEIVGGSSDLDYLCKNSAFFRKGTAYMFSPNAGKLGPGKQYRIGLYKIGNKSAFDAAEAKDLYNISNAADGHPTILGEGLATVTALGVHIIYGGALAGIVKSIMTQKTSDFVQSA